MCGITGWVDWNKDLSKYPTIIKNMTETLTSRGPDDSGIWLSNHCALGHRRLSVIDPHHGAQPMSRTDHENHYTIVYNGELYNTLELKNELIKCGYLFRTNCDTEVLLVAYIEWGSSCVERLNGIFAFAIWDHDQQSLLLARDRVGVKPLFFSILDDGELLFGSEPKAILAHPDFKPEVDSSGLAEIFIIGPARTPGHAIYKKMEELKPGCIMIYNRTGIKKTTYWCLESKPHTDDAEKTAENVRYLLQDTVQRQLVSDVPVCSLLSGGLDSSALTTFATQYYRQQQRGQLSTFSVDYVDNDQHFQENAFQPNSDNPWINRMSSYLNTKHHTIQFDTPELVNALNAVVAARDLPGMADIDASLYLFCREIKKSATVAISGEAADEIFGGYPWFHRQDALDADTFPWSLATKHRASLLTPELREWIKPEQYVAQRYQQALDEVPRLPGESKQLARMREMSYLNITRFMPTLLDRKDRMSMKVGLEVRVPFCDHRLIEYVWNVPWEMKFMGQREKGLLRHALKGILPEDVIARKKSPYPKTHNPNYLTAVKSWFMEIIKDPASPILQFIDVNQVRQIANEQAKFNVPWFGQLMTGPQMFAYFIQVNTWLKQYRISVR